MRPKNLKFPFTWEERQPAFYQGVLIVPTYYDRHQEWEAPQDLFPEEREIFIEYCSGNGDWVIEKAKKNPNQYWIAVELQFKRVRKIWSKMHNHGVKNFLIVCGEALTFTRYYLPADKVEQIYVNFPDPWPKERQAKHRLVQKPFVEELARIVKRGGKMTFATDDACYSSQMIETVLQVPKWKSSFTVPYYVHEIENYGGSWFENLWRQKGRNFYYMQFERCN